MKMPPLQSVTTALAIAMLAIGGAAYAGQTTPPPTPAPGQMQPPSPGGGGRGGGMAFERMDTNGDGKVSRAEYDAASAQRFQRLDVNGDGVLDASEMAPRRGMGRRPAPNE